MHRGAGLSESEAEPDGEHNITELPQAVAGRGNMRAQQSAVRLTEVRPGPRAGLGAEVTSLAAPSPEGELLLPLVFPDRASDDTAAHQNPGGCGGGERAVPQFR